MERVIRRCHRHQAVLEPYLEDDHFLFCPGGSGGRSAHLIGVHRHDWWEVVDTKTDKILYSVSCDGILSEGPLPHGARASRMKPLLEPDPPRRRGTGRPRGQIGASIDPFPEPAIWRRHHHQGLS